MKVHFEHIYEHIGYLFYALATERGKVNAVTFNKLRSLIHQRWYPAGNGTTVDTNLVTYLLSGLRNAFDTSMSPEVAFDHFRRYYDLHTRPFGQALCAKILATAHTITSDFAGNGSPSSFLASLERLFKVNPMALV